MDAGEDRGTDDKEDWVKKEQKIKDRGTEVENKDRVTEEQKKEGKEKDRGTDEQMIKKIEEQKGKKRWVMI